MAKRTIPVELDEGTIRALALLGEPASVLARLALSFGEGSHLHPRRDQTNTSLQVERDKADDRDTRERAEVDVTADEVVRVARERADQVVATARDDADREGIPRSTDEPSDSERERALADRLLERERAGADASLEHERAQRKKKVGQVVAAERGATDQDLSGERMDSDALVVEQREANAHMLGTALRAHDVAHEAEAARRCAEVSERELRAAAEFRELFIGILGHDLRNPLNAIVMGAALQLRRGILDAQDAETAARIIRSTQRMTRLIAQLLDFTHTRLGGGLPLEPEPTDLRGICRNVVEEFDATIRLEVVGDVTGVWDPDRLAEVLSNLTGNAVEYAAPGTAVRVTARGDGEQVVIEIQNHGHPIPADLLPFIFEPFRRGRPGEKSVTGNLGLGLYIARQIVVSHGGTIEVRSADGTTTFVVCLPRRSPPPPAIAPG